MRGSLGPTPTAFAAIYAKYGVAYVAFETEHDCLTEGDTIIQRNYCSANGHHRDLPQDPSGLTQNLWPSHQTCVKIGSFDG